MFLPAGSRWPAPGKRGDSAGELSKGAAVVSRWQPNLGRAYLGGPALPNCLHTCLLGSLALVKGRLRHGCELWLSGPLHEFVASARRQSGRRSRAGASLGGKAGWLAAVGVPWPGWVELAGGPSGLLRAGLSRRSAGCRLRQAVLRAERAGQ